MRKSLTLMTLLLAVTAGFAGERTLRDWLKDLDARIRRVDDKRQGRLTAAASVRGAKQDDKDKKLYWKGRKDAQPVQAEELDQFKAAVALAQNGKAADAQKALEAFLGKFPSSPLAPDAKETLALLSKEAPAAATSDDKSPAAAPAGDAKP